MKNLHYKLEINNSVEYVFSNLFEKEIYLGWTKPFNPSSDYKGVLALGEEMFFHDADNNGMIATVSKYIENEVIELNYVASVMGGEKYPFDTDENHERYTFTSVTADTSILDIDLNIPDEYAEMFKVMWDQAIVIIQQLLAK